MQTIEAINHLKKKMSVGKNKMSLTDYDRASLNRIIEHYNESSKAHSASQTMFKKLFLNEFLRQAVLYDKGTRLALTNIEDLLRIPLLDYYDSLAEESKFKKFAELVKDLEYVERENLSEDELKRAIQKDHNKELLEGNFEKLKETLLGGYSKEKAKSFLANHLYEIILTYKDFK